MNKVNEPHIRYTRRGGIYVKPSDIAKTQKGRDLIAKNSNSKLAKSIRSKEVAKTK
jgi:hypothetical protein